MARETLDQSRIITTAIELLDEQGLAGLSMRRLGQTLGVTAPTLYWHVKSKEDLIELASDRVWQSIPLLDPQAAGWRQAAIDLGCHTYRLGVAHHWLISATTDAYAYGHGMARYQDHSYAIFEIAGFTDDKLDWAVNTMFNFVLGATFQDSARVAALQHANSSGQDRVHDTSEKANRILAEFPRLLARTAAQRSPASVASPQDIAPMIFGLEAVLDGLASTIRESTTNDQRHHGTETNAQDD